MDLLKRHADHYHARQRYIHCATPHSLHHSSGVAVVGVAILGMYRPCSPSVCTELMDENRGVRSAVHYDELDYVIHSLIADAVVGVHKMRHQLVALRQCCCALRDAIDAAVNGWCARFTHIRNMWMTRAGGRRRILPRPEQEWSLQLKLDMEMMWERAFTGSLTLSNSHPTMRSFLHINHITPQAYYCALARRCMLCGECIFKGTQPSYVSDSNIVDNDPVYLFAHAHCQKKHMVCVKGSFQAYEASPSSSVTWDRELHRELQAVQHLFTFNRRRIEDGTVETLHFSKQMVFSALSLWFTAMYEWQAACTTVPLWVWLRPHPLVNSGDTLYGALCISEEHVKLAMRQQEERNALSMALAFQRKEELRESRRRLARAYEAELRVWLGKGKTRWRTIEHLEALNEDMLKSAGLNRFLGGEEHLTRLSAAASELIPCLHTIQMFSAALDNMQYKPSAALLDCLISKIGLQNLFIQRVVDLHLLNDEQMDAAIYNESKAYAAVFDAMEIINGNCIQEIKLRTNGRVHDSATSYDVRVRASLPLRGGPVTFTSHFFISYEDLCLLKYRVTQALPEHLRRRLPKHLPHASVPPNPAYGCDTFLLLLLDVCLQKDSGTARTIALALIFNYRMCIELMSSALVGWCTASDRSQESESMDSEG